MVEAIQCPSCQTRYGLRPARVRSGLRRAQCFRCGDVFHIEPEVKRLLTALDSPASTASVPLSTLAEAIAQAPESQQPAPTMPALEAHDLALGDLELPEPEPAPSIHATAPVAALAVDEAPTLDLPPLGEETLSIPEPGGTYASAKDAIARLFGDTPLAPSPAEALRGALNQGRSMNMDADLKALEDTLGGVKAEELSTRPIGAMAAAPEATPMEEEDLPHAASTMRINASEMMASMGMAPVSAPHAAPEPAEISQEEVTMVLPPPPSPASVSTDPSALRLRIGDQVYAGLDLPTIAKWIEEGRVLEEHQVARGTSEVWMDAAKVPALRAVFDRLRRGRMGGGELPPPPPSGPDTSQMKRGLFGGIFGGKKE